MTADLHIPHEVAAVLGWYVYALRDPRSGRVFYVGKGRGERIAAHRREAGANPQAENAKLQTLREIEADGQAADLLFLRTDIPNSEIAYTVEQAVIDAFLADGHPLTNLVRGHDSDTFGLASLDAMVARHRAIPCPPIDAPLIMVKMQRWWRPDSTAADIYRYTRGNWKIGPGVRAQSPLFCLGVAYGVVRGAYRVESWHPSPEPWDQGKDRWGFEGPPAAELADVVGTEVRDVFGGRVMYRKFLTGYPGAG